MWLVCALCLIALQLTLGAAIAAAQVRQPSEAVTVVTAYEMARNRGDIDAALAYFADDATLVQRNTVYSGRDEIRRYLESSIGRGRFVVVANRRLLGTGQ